MVTEYRVVGQSIARVDGFERVTGKAVFGPDLTLPGTLYCKILRSPHAHARIRRIDASRALELPGVKAVLTPDDLPSLEGKTIAVVRTATMEARHLRQLFLAEDHVVFHGQPVVAVAAVDLATAEEALSRIDVDYEPLPAVFDVLDAIKPDAPVIHPDLQTRGLAEEGGRPTNIAVHMEAERGDLEDGFREAEVVIEREYRIGTAHPGYIEPQACTVDIEAGERLTVYTTTQGAFRLQTLLAVLLDIPMSKLRVVPLEIGGGFGGKGVTVPELPTALLAMKTGRPVKTVMSREEVFRATRPAPGAYAWVKVGAKRTGEITAFQGRFYLDGGGLPGDALAVNGALTLGLSPYKVPNLRIDSYDVLTNRPRAGSYRAPGGPEAAFAVESAFDEMAEELGVDPLDLRIVNANEDGEPMVDGMPMPTTRLRQVLQQVKDHPAWSTPVPPGRGRGIALGMRREGAGVSSASIALHSDATFEVVMGSVDLTGTRTTMAQYAAEELGVDMRDIAVRVGDTGSVGYTDASAGSRTTYVTGVAVTQAAQELLRQLKALAADRFRVDPEEVEYGDRTFYVRENPEQRMTLAEIARANVGGGAGALMGTGVASGSRPVTSTAVAVIEVEVEEETGRVRVVKYTAFQDPGRAVNPMEVEGQMQGSAAQGIGWALWESYRWNDQGVLLNANFLDYQMPTTLDVPMVETVFVGGPAPENPYGVRGAGEVGIIPPIPAIANAVRRATGVRIREAPLTPEHIFWALQQGGES